MYITKTCQYQYPDSKVKCETPLTEKVYNFSMGKYNKALCYGHQKREEPMPEVDYEERYG